MVGSHIKQKLDVLGIIPARGGSKGIPRKNIAMLNGIPLIAYSIRAALKSKYITKAIVSTDDTEIAQISRDHGADVPFLRPAELSQDDTPTIHVLRHTLDYLNEQESYCPEIIVLLQPTSPLRNAVDIDLAIQKMIDTGCQSVVSVTEITEHPYWMYTVAEDYLRPIAADLDIGVYARRQDLPPIYRLNGAIYVTKRDLIYQQNSLLSSDTKPYFMPKHRSIDIDEPMDLAFAEILLQRLL